MTSPKAQGDDRKKLRDNNGRFLPGNEYAAKPGECRNPDGRPKKKPITEEIAKLLEAVNPDDPDKRTNAKLIADALIGMAIKGDLGAIKESADRTEGKPTTSVELSGEVDINGNAKHLLAAKIAALSKRSKAKADTPDPQ